MRSLQGLFENALSDIGAEKWNVSTLYSSFSLIKGGKVRVMFFMIMICSGAILTRC